MRRLDSQDYRGPHGEGNHAVIPFVLTGTIIPNAVPTVHSDAQQRRNEYILAIRHYLGFGPVYFLENSDYPVLEDSFFTTTPGLQTIQHPKPKETIRGKGYQEFEMLDAFVSNHSQVDTFIKITGRYVYTNIGNIAPRMAEQLEGVGMVIDLMARKQMAITSLFAVSRHFYSRHVMNTYLDMDDRRGQWAEYILYNRIRTTRDSTFPQPSPILQAVAGSTGKTISMRSKGFRPWMKNVERRLFAAAGIRELLF